MTSTIGVKARYNKLGGQTGTAVITPAPGTTPTGTPSNVPLTIVDATTARTAGVTDNNNIIEFTNAAPITFTIQTYANVPLPVGAILFAQQGGTGQVTFVGAAGVLLESSDALKSRAQKSYIGVKHASLNKWEALGDLESQFPGVSILGRAANSTGAPAPIVAASDLQVMMRRAGALLWSFLTGSDVSNTPAGNIAATTVQAAINELDAEKQPLNAYLTAISALSPVADNIMQFKGGTWVVRTPAQYKIDLALVKADVGLGNVDNTSDANKPVSTAQAAADAAVQAFAIQRGNHTGTQAQSTITNLVSDLALKADLVSGKVPAAQLPSYVDDVLEYANLAAFPGTGETGKLYIAIDTGYQYRWSGSAYIQLVSSPGSTDAVPEGTVNLYFTEGRVRAALLTGLSLVTNAAISATDSVLSAFGKLQKQLTDLATSLALKAPIASPTFTGTTTTALLNVGGNLNPTTHNAYQLGLVGTRWYGVYAGIGDFVGQLRTTGNARFEGTGAGLNGVGVGSEFYTAGGAAWVESYDRTNSVYAPLNLGGLSVVFKISNVTVATVSSTGMAVLGLLTVNGANVVRSEAKTPTEMHSSGSLLPGLYTIDFSGGLPNAGNTGTYKTGYFHVIHVNRPVYGGYQSQLAMRMSNGEGNGLWMRAYNGSTSAWNEWEEVSLNGANRFINPQSANYTLAITDRNQLVRHPGISNITFTVPASVFPDGSYVDVVNDNAIGSLSIAQGTGMTLYKDNTAKATTGTRTVALGSFARIWFVASNVAYITGAGVS